MLRQHSCHGRGRQPGAARGLGSCQGCSCEADARSSGELASAELAACWCRSPCRLQRHLQLVESKVRLQPGGRLLQSGRGLLVRGCGPGAHGRLAVRWGWEAGLLRGLPGRQLCCPWPPLANRATRHQWFMSGAAVLAAATWARTCAAGQQTARPGTRHASSMWSAAAGSATRSTANAGAPEPRGGQGQGRAGAEGGKGGGSTNLQPAVAPAAMVQLTASRLGCLRLSLRPQPAVQAIGGWAGV